MSASLRSTASRVNDRLLQFEEWIGVTLISVIFGLLLFQVIMRYLFPSSFPWIEEIARLMFVWVVLIGAGFAVGKQSHITVTAIADAILKSHSHIATAVGLVLSIVTGLLVAIAGWELVQTLGAIRSSASGLSRGLFYLPATIGFGMVSVHSLLLLVSGEYRATANQDSEVQAV